MTIMKKRGIVVFVVISFLSVGAWYALFGPRQSPSVLSPITQVVERPLDMYTIDRLSLRLGKRSEIILDDPIASTSAYTVNLFHYKSDGKRVTGVAHIPNGKGPFPVIVQFRGYVPRELYQPGIGTKRSAEVFAKNGFISLAPDFLGYGGSDNPGDDVFEERFQTYTVAIDLLASIGTLPQADADRIGMWGHSNGGHIALTVLEITRGRYPTVLWAPVTKPFPYSILYYTDEADDHGKALRKKLADFEKYYDADQYAMTNFLDRIAAPIQLHQGTADDAVPATWNDAFVAVLKEQSITIEYFVYPRTDHNMQPEWNTVILRDIDFFRRYL